jgi:uncharacterized protein YqeY
MTESLLMKIKADTLEAMKARDEARLGTLRLLSAALHNREIEKRTKGEDGELAENDILDVIRREVKKRREAIELYEKGKRRDLVDKESGELKILEAYLPPALSPEEIKKIVDAVVAETKPSGPKDFGRVMGVAMQKVAGRAPAGDVANAVREALGK